MDVLRLMGRSDHADQAHLNRMVVHERGQKYKVHQVSAELEK